MQVFFKIIFYYVLFLFRVKIYVISLCFVSFILRESVKNYYYIYIGNYIRLIVIDLRFCYKLIHSVPKVKDFIVFIFLSSFL